MRKYLIHTQNGTQIFTEKEIINNAMEQREKGVKPAYHHTYIIEGKREVMPAGWLVYSTFEDGCCIVYPREKDGKLVIFTGWQGEVVTQ